MKSKQTGRRIVSKREYVQICGARIGLKALGASVYALAFVCLLFFLWVACSCYADYADGARVHSKAILFSMFLLVCSTVFLVMGEVFMRFSANIKPVVPLTRATTATLPVADSLVRASSEPAQAQQAVLLRRRKAGAA